MDSERLYKDFDKMGYVLIRVIDFFGPNYWQVISHKMTHRYNCKNLREVKDLRDALRISECVSYDDTWHVA